MKKADRIIYILFIIGLASSLLLFLGIFIRGQKDIMDVENRTASKFQTFLAKNYFDGTYQSSLENALADQILFEKTIKTKMYEINNKLYEIETINHSCTDYYLISKNTYTYNCSGYLLEKPKQLDADTKNKYQLFANQYNNIKGVKKYVYFVSTSRTSDFNDNSFNDDHYNYLKASLNTFNNVERLKITSFADYKNYFYKTDHHWNYNGSYQGYKDLVNMMFDEEQKYVETKDYFNRGFYYYGSRATGSQYYKSKEIFEAYTYNIKKPYKTYIDSQETIYGNQDEYLKGNFDHNSVTNHYAGFYGNSIREVIFDFFDNKKDNLLVIANSNSNALIIPLASHYNKTYKIDLRFYKEFDIENYIKENDIDVVLILGNNYFYSRNDFLLKEV